MLSNNRQCFNVFNAVVIAGFIVSFILFAASDSGKTVLAAGANLYSIDITIEGTRPYKAFALPPEIINHAGTTALRVIDRESGEEVPYFIHSGVYELEAQTAYVQFTFLRQFERDGFYYLDFRVDSPPNTDPLVSHLALETTQREFLKNITVLGSHDDQRWNEITTGLVYGVADVSQREIDLDGVHRYGYYRLRIPVPWEYADFHAYGMHRQIWEERVTFTRSAEADFELVSEDGISTVTLLGLAGNQASMQNLRVTGVRIETESLFKRSIYTDHGGPWILYRLFFQDTELTDTFIPYPGRPQQAEMSFTIADHDDRPIYITGILVEYASDYVVFRAEEGRQYVLHYGGTLTRPVYDIENFRDMIIQEGFDRVSLLGPAQQLTVETDYEQRDFSRLFNIVIGLAGVVLVAVAATAIYRQNKV